ncbi:MAG: winged helix-turn-helix domain-containing protein [Nitrososphaerota archaeon]
MRELEQFVRILELANAGGVTPYRIGRILGINYQRLKRILDYAVNEGIMTYKQVRAGAKVYELTEKGERLLNIWVSFNYEKITDI